MGHSAKGRAHRAWSKAHRAECKDFAGNRMLGLRLLEDRGRRLKIGCSILIPDL